MIIKSSELSKIDINKNLFILLYGNNQGFKKQAINSILKNKEDFFQYEEKEILENEINFINSTLTESLFEEKKIILINRASDKILKIIEQLTIKRPKNLSIILNANTLEKKSKLRSFFEKNKECISIAFYPDNEQTLSRLTSNFFKEKNIPLSYSDINLIISKSNGDRGVLISELEKIENYARKGKKINSIVIGKLINLAEDHSISELIDNCLAKNQKKTLSIINENNFTNEDCVLITRIFLNKSKRILQLSSDYKNSQNLDLTISSAKPPIFWKDKDITKKQILKWSPEGIKLLIYKLSDLELLIKTNIKNSINLLIDFILEQSSETNN